MSSAVTSESVSGYHVLGPGAEKSARHWHAWSLSDVRKDLQKCLGLVASPVQKWLRKSLLVLPGRVQPSDRHTVKLPLVSWAMLGPYFCSYLMAMHVIRINLLSYAKLHSGRAVTPAQLMHSNLAGLFGTKNSVQKGRGRQFMSVAASASLCNHEAILGAQQAPFLFPFGEEIPQFGGGEGNQGLLPVV